MDKKEKILFWQFSTLLFCPVKVFSVPANGWPRHKMYLCVRPADLPTHSGVFNCSLNKTKVCFVLWGTNRIAPPFSTSSMKLVLRKFFSNKWLDVQMFLAKLALWWKPPSCVQTPTAATGWNMAACSSAIFLFWVHQKGIHFFFFSGWLRFRV